MAHYRERANVDSKRNSCICLLNPYINSAEIDYIPTACHVLCWALEIREEPRQNGNIVFVLVRETSENVRERRKKGRREREEKREGETEGWRCKQVLLSSDMYCD